MEIDDDMLDAFDLGYPLHLFDDPCRRPSQREFLKELVAQRAAQQLSKLEFLFLMGDILHYPARHFVRQDRLRAAENLMGHSQGSFEQGPPDFRPDLVERSLARFGND